MYRDLSLSLAAHAALMAALLVFSATRQPVRIPEIVRPVRLITSLELPRQAAAPAPAPRLLEPAPPPRPSERPARPRAAEPAPPRAARLAPAPVKPVTPVAVPKIAFPTAAPATADRTRPAPRPAETKTDATLRDRLARRLSAPPEARRTETEHAAPAIASLPRPEAPADPPRAVPPSSSGATAPSDPVQPVGFFPHAWYLAVLKERIFARWAPPSEFYLGAGSVAALVSFRIGRDGRIGRVAVKESSGHARFDRSALAAVQGLARLPALPEQYAEETLDVVIRFQNE